MHPDEFAEAWIALADVPKELGHAHPALLCLRPVDPEEIKIKTVSTTQFSLVNSIDV